ncbi:MAG: hypothetical protein HKN27_00430 [Silicimonas sp.]|nr:hypothetical protein [Silicimonas sp.]
MKLGKLLLTTSLCASMAVPAFSQGRPFKEIDTNGDDFLSESELTEAFGERGAARILARSDSDGDGVLTRAEIRSSDDEDDDESDESDDEEDDESDDNDESDEDSDESDETDDEDSDESDDDEDSDSDESDSDESDDSEDDED